MLVLKPIKDKKELEKLLGKEYKNAFGYTAFLSDKIIGEIGVYYDNASVCIAALETYPQKDKALADGLIRASLDKAANENILFYNFSYTVKENWAEILKEASYSLEEDYIYKFFTSTHKCTGCGNCGKKID